MEVLSSFNPTFEFNGHAFEMNSPLLTL